MMQWNKNKPASITSLIKSCWKKNTKTVDYKTTVSITNNTLQKAFQRQTKVLKHIQHRLIDRL